MVIELVRGNRHRGRSLGCPCRARPNFVAAKPAGVGIPRSKSEK